MCKYVCMQMYCVFLPVFPNFRANYVSTTTVVCHQIFNERRLEVMPS